MSWFFLSGQALRRYMLLGQGDFIRHLMDLLELVLCSFIYRTVKFKAFAVAVTCPSLHLPFICITWLALSRQQCVLPMPSMTAPRPCRDWMWECWTSAQETRDGMSSVCITMWMAPLARWVAVLSTCMYVCMHASPKLWLGIEKGQGQGRAHSSMVQQVICR